jgi:hypothetical protein
MALRVGEHVDALDEWRERHFPVLLQHPPANDAFRPAEQCQRSVAQVRQHQRRNLDEIAQQVALGDGRLARVGGSRPIDAIEMRQRDRMAVDS